MARPHRIQIKLFFARSTGADVSPYVAVFHRWIQRQPFDQLLIDIHNYAHVHQGPGILLVGHEGDFAIDASGGRTGLLYRLKRDTYDTIGEGTAIALRRLAQGALALESEPSLNGQLEVDRTQFELSIPDRLSYPNRADTFDQIEDELSAVIRDVSGANNLLLERIDNDAREPLSIRVALPAGFSLEDLATVRAGAGVA